MKYILGLILSFSTFALAGEIKAVDAPEGSNIVWRRSGPGGGGWIQSVTWDPIDPNTIYAGSDVGGFYISFDKGKHFEIRNNGLHDYFVQSIAVNPSNTAIILLGTQGGIFRTTNRGKNWVQITNGLLPQEESGYSNPIGVIRFNPLRPGVAYAGIGRPRTNAGGRGTIYRSDDTGSSWHRLPTTAIPTDAIICDLSIKPDDDRVLLVATDKGIYRSDNEGTEWTNSSRGLPHGEVEKLQFAPSNPKIVYTSLKTTAVKGETWNGGIYRSDDAGVTWRDVNGDGMPKLLRKNKDDDIHKMSNVFPLAVDSRNAEIVYAGNDDWYSPGLRKTGDGGRTWSLAEVKDGGAKNMQIGWLDFLGTAIKCIAVSPANPNCVAFGTSAHLFLSENGGGSWVQSYCEQFPDGRFKGNGLEPTGLFDVVPDPARAQRVYYCYFDIGLLISDDYGTSFRKSSFNSVDCFTAAVDPKSPSTIWTCTGQKGKDVGQIYVSHDDGYTWKSVGNPGSGLPAGRTIRLLLDAASPVGHRRLVATLSGNGIYETINGGDNWHCINGNLHQEAVKNPRALLLDSQNPRHLMVALSGPGDHGSGIYETKDGGDHWESVSTQEIFGDVYRIISPVSDLKILYMASRKFYDPKLHKVTPGGVYKSGDGGRTWTQLLDFNFVSSVAVNPQDSNIVYAGTLDSPYHDNCVAEGILRSTDGGQSWMHENSDISYLNFTSIAVSPANPKIIYAGSAGNSVFVGEDKGIKKR